MDNYRDRVNHNGDSVEHNMEHVVDIDRQTLSELQKQQSILAMDYALGLGNIENKKLDELAIYANHLYKRASALRYLYHYDAGWFKAFSIGMNFTVPLVAAIIIAVVALTAVFYGDDSKATRTVTIIGNLLIGALGAIKLGWEPIVNQKDNERAGDKYGKVANKITQTLLISRSDKVQMYKLLSYATRKLGKYEGQNDHQDEQAIQNRMVKIADIIDINETAN